MATRAAVVARRDDDGLSLIEVVVAMVLLSLVALAFLPVIANAATAAARGATVATANRLVSDQLEMARTAGATACLDDLGGAEVPVGSPVTDVRGVVLQVRTDVVLVEGSCTPGASALLRLTASVTRDDAPTVAVATASTLISIGGP